MFKAIVKYKPLNEWLVPWVNLPNAKQRMSDGASFIENANRRRDSVSDYYLIVTT